MTEVTFGEGRKAVTFGASKINLHDAAAPVEPHALRPTPGSADLCFVVDGPLDAVATELRDAGVEIEIGPVERTGAQGTMESLYVRDPDANLVELSVYREGSE
ncbi:VOC family protein [Actinomycetospora atypica]|uniref:VOC family protein n=1 Tax=Actinomycetospora atypica TaxID=1290095 RepID=A0ABV9YU37_9PSEU